MIINHRNKHPLHTQAASAQIIIVCPAIQCGGISGLLYSNIPYSLHQCQNVFVTQGKFFEDQILLMDVVLKELIRHLYQSRAETDDPHLTTNL